MSKAEFSVPALTKNCNETLILSYLAKGDKHGYQLALDIEESSQAYFNFNHGTLYPILHKLEKEGLIKGHWRHEGPKRKRKYYSITRKGRDYLQVQLGEWNRFFEHFDAIVGGLKK